VYQHLCSSICVPASMFQHLCSSTCVPAFVFQHLCSSILCSSICVPASMFQHLCSSTCVPTFVFQHLCSSICVSASVFQHLFQHCVFSVSYSPVFQLDTTLFQDSPESFASVRSILWMSARELQWVMGFPHFQ
jgi:hypothetical protein